jgi:hypothetical protein
MSASPSRSTSLGRLIGTLWHYVLRYRALALAIVVLGALQAIVVKAPFLLLKMVADAIGEFMGGGKAEGTAASAAENALESNEAAADVFAYLDAFRDWLLVQLGLQTGGPRERHPGRGHPARRPRGARARFSSTPTASSRASPRHASSSTNATASPRIS